MALSPTEIEAFLQKRYTMVIATLRRDGTPHLSTVWYRWDGARFWIATNRDRVKYRNMRRDPRVNVLVDDPPRETSVAASGRAETVATDEAAYEGALAIVGRYVDDPHAYPSRRRAPFRTSPFGRRAPLRASLAERAGEPRPRGEPRALVRITPERMTSWSLT